MTDPWYVRQHTFLNGTNADGGEVEDEYIAIKTAFGALFAQLAPVFSASPVSFITSDTVITVGGTGANYATLTEAFFVLRAYRIMPGAKVTLRMTGNTTEPATLCWDHIDSDKIVLDANGANRKITLGTLWIAPLRQAYPAPVLEPCGFYLPPGRSFLRQHDQRTVTFEAPATVNGQAGLYSIAVRFDGVVGIYQADPSNVLEPLRFKVSSAGMTFDAGAALVFNGARLPNTPEAIDPIPTATQGLRFIIDSSVTQTQRWPVWFFQTSGYVHIYGESGDATTNSRDQIYAAESSNLIIRSEKMGLYVEGGPSVIQFVLAEPMRMQGGFITCFSAGTFQTGSLIVVGDSSHTHTKTTPGGLRQGVMEIKSGMDVVVHNLMLDNDEQATSGTTGDAALLTAYGAGALIRLNGCSVTNPPASDPLAVWQAQGTIVMSIASTYGGTFNTNRSNADATWNASTGQFLS